MASRAAAPYRIVFDSRAERDLASMPAGDRRRLAKRIDSLANDPRPRGCKKLHGEDGFYRVRVGDFRIIYAVRDALLLVLVVKVGNRRDVYR